jgi:predicted nucleic acid-binding protein
MTTTYVFDASAILRYNDDEAGARRVEEILIASAGGNAALLVSSVQWGEIAANVRKRFGGAVEERTLTSLKRSELEIVAASEARAVRAAGLRVDHKIGFADAFALELAMSFEDSVLVTADYGFKAVADLVRIEFLPAK